MPLGRIGWEGQEGSSLTWVQLGKLRQAHSRHRPI